MTTAAQQHRALWRFMARLDSVRMGLRDRMSDGAALVEELELAADALEHLSGQASELAAQLDAAR